MTEVSDAVAIVAQVRAAMIACLEKRPDGRYYATAEGCVRLRRILDRHNINASVAIGDDGRFEVRMGQQQ